MIHAADGICGFRQAVCLAREHDCASRDALCALICEGHGRLVREQAVRRQQKLLHSAVRHGLFTLLERMAL